MERRAIIIAIAVVAVLAIVLSALFYWGLQSYFPGPVVHETNRWAVIKDANGDSLAVESSNDSTWDQLVQLYQNGTAKWIGGTVEAYGSSWGFRFAPENITIADFTAEGLQTTISGISGDLSYWLGKQAYVSATVVEVHSPS